MPRSTALLVTLAACGSPSAPATSPARAAAERRPAPEPAPEPAPPAPAPVPKQSLEFDDFWTVLGITRGATERDVVAALGPPSGRSVRKATFDEGDEVTLEYEPDVYIALPPSGGTQLTLRDGARALRSKFPADPALSLLGQSCEEAARRLTFMDEVGKYRSCKHYSEAWFLDVTVKCRGEVSMVVVVWEPLPADLRGAPQPADHCI